jgi:hypothetical protein
MSKNALSLQKLISTIKPAPLFLGYYLLTLSVAGCLIIPVSGFWLFIPQAFVIIFANRKK